VHLESAEKFATLKELSEKYGCPWIEYDEKINQPLPLLLRLDLEKLKQEGWFPHTIREGKATIIACAPTQDLAEKVKQALGVKSVDFMVTLPPDLIRIIENNQDVNPGCPTTFGRTLLARVRTYLSGLRSLLAHYRTVLPKGRTGLAFIRTGISCVTISLLFLRIFGAEWFLLLELPLLISGCVMTFDGVKWYLPARQLKGRVPTFTETRATGGTTALAVLNEEQFPLFNRTNEVAGADELRSNWTSLSPVMRRRYLACDRTDYAEERTLLAIFRTRMGKVRTGLAFVRTGISFISLGLGLILNFSTSTWLILDISLIAVGAIIVAEGFLWYAGGRQAGVEGNTSVKQKFQTNTVWDFFFPHRHLDQDIRSISLALPVRSHDLPGIWGTTGLALERTVLAERRNVMARLRTVMARGRTGLAFIRTGLNLSMIGVAFVLYFGTEIIAWNIFNWLLIICGLLLIGDGLYWSWPAERLRREFPYCYDDMEIAIPDYGIPCRSWDKVMFSHE